MVSPSYDRTLVDAAFARAAARGRPLMGQASRVTVANDDQVPPDSMRTGCCLASMQPFGGWNFHCFGNGVLTLYRCGAAAQTALHYRLDASLSQRLREIGAATTGDDAARTRKVLELFGHAAARAV